MTAVLRGTSYRFEILRERSQVAAHRAAWTDWAQRCSPFALPGFFDAWCEAFAGTRTGFVIAGFRDGALQLLLPMWHPNATPAEWHSLGDFRADYTDSVVATEQDSLGHAFWRWLLLRAPCQSARIALLPTDTLLGRTIPHHGIGRRGRAFDAGSSLLRSGRARYFDLHSYHAHPYADRVQIRDLAGRMTSKNHTRKVGLMRREGEVSYARLRSASQIEPLLPTLFAMHIANFQETGRESQFQQTEERRFYELLATSPSLGNTTCLDVLSIAGRPVAMHLGFEHAKTFYWYKPAFDVASSKLSPGRVLLAYIFARAFEEQLERVDLLKGIEGYKDDWGSQVRPTCSAVLAEPQLGQLARRALARFRRR